MDIDFDSLPEEKKIAAFEHYIDLACRCQNYRNLVKGCQEILKLPREWVVDRLMNNIPSLEDDYEYAQFMGVLKNIGNTELFTKYLDWGLVSADPAIAELAETLNIVFKRPS